MKKALVSLALVLVLPAALPAAAPARGSLDSSFGAAGKLMLSSSLEEGSGTTPLGDGRTVVAGYKRMLALLPSGQVDRSFGEAGYAPFVASSCGRALARVDLEAG